MLTQTRATGPHTIQFTSAIGSNRTINLQTALPDITEEVTIIGLPSNDIIVRRGVTAVHFRIFTTTTSLELRHLWIMDGSVQAAGHRCRRRGDSMPRAH